MFSVNRDVPKLTSTSGNQFPQLRFAPAPVTDVIPHIKDAKSPYKFLFDQLSHLLLMFFWWRIVTLGSTGECLGDVPPLVSGCSHACVSLLLTGHTVSCTQQKGTAGKGWHLSYWRMQNGISRWHHLVLQLCCFELYRDSCGRLGFVVLAFSLLFLMSRLWSLEAIYKQDWPLSQASWKRSASKDQYIQPKSHKSWSIHRSSSCMLKT